MWTESNPVGWFEIPAANLKRAQTFYEFIFGIAMTPFTMGNLKMAWFPFLENKRGSTGTLVQAESYVPSHSGVLIYFSTGDISGVLQRVREKGGKVITERMSIGEYGFVGHFEDSEGNRVGLHSRK